MNPFVLRLAMGKLVGQTVSLGLVRQQVSEKEKF